MRFLSVVIGICVTGTLTSTPAETKGDNHRVPAIIGKSGSFPFQEIVGLVDWARQAEPDAIIMQAQQTTGAVDRYHSVLNQEILFSALMEKDQEFALQFIARHANDPRYTEVFPQLFDQLRATTLQEYRSLYNRVPYPWQSRVKNRLLVRLAETDPAAAFHFYLQQSSLDSDLDSELLVTLSRVWARQDPTALQEAIRQLTDLDLRYDALLGWCGHAATTGPDALDIPLDLIVDERFRDRLLNAISKDIIIPPATLPGPLLEWVPPGTTRAQLYAKYAASWAETDPPTAIRWIRQLESRNEREAATNGLLFALIPIDLEAASETVDAIDQTGVLSPAIKQIAERWAYEDPLHGLDWAMTLKNPNPRRDALKILFPPALDADPETVFAAYDSLELYQDRRELLTPVIRNLVPQHTDLARTFIENHLDSDLRNSGESALIFRTATLDPAAALEALNQLEDEERRSEYLWAVFNNASIHQSEVALKLAESLPVPAERTRALQVIAANNSHKNPQMAIRAWEQIPEGLEKEDSLKRVIHGMLYGKPENAMALIQSLQETRYLSESFWTDIAVYLSDIPDADPIRWATLAKDPVHRVAFLDSYFLRVSRDQPISTLEWLESIQNPELYQKYAPELISRIAQSSPEEVIPYLPDLMDPAQRENAITQIAETWSGYDLEGALDWSMTLDAPDSYYALSAVSRQILYHDYDRAGQMAVDHPAILDYRFPLKDLASRWGKQQPRGALRWACRLPEGDHRERALRIILGPVFQRGTLRPPEVLDLIEGSLPPMDWIRLVSENWGSADPKATLEWLHSLPSSPLVQTEILKTGRRLAETDPEAVIGLIDQLPPSSEKQRIVETALRHWLQNDPHRVLGWFEGHAPGYRLLDAAVGALREIPREAAAEWIGRQPESFQRAFLAETLGRRWVREDPDGFFDWLDTLHSEELGDRVRGGAISAIPQEPCDPGLDSWVLKQKDSGLRRHWASLAAARQAEANPHSAWDWAVKLEDPQLRKAALTTVLGHWYYSDPEMARRAWNTLEDKEVKAAVFPNWIRETANRDLNQAKRWLKENSGKFDRRPAIKQLVWAYSQIDPGESLEWIVALENPRERDVALHAFIEQNRTFYPLECLNLVWNIEEDALRMQALVASAKSWMRYDIEGVEKTIRDLPLTPSKKDLLFSLIHEDIRNLSMPRLDRLSPFAD